jgi:hypothetical protein
MIATIESSVSSAARALFRDPAAGALFDRRGYVVTDLLGSTEVAALRELFREAYPETHKGFISTTFARKGTLKTRVMEGIRAITLPRIAERMQGYRVFGTGFFSKWGPDSAVPPHQDWSFVDERRYATALLWIPLCDVSGANGPLCVVPGSHRGLPMLRSSTLPVVFQGHEEALLARGIPLQLQAGMAVVYSPATIHFSPPNLTPEVRAVASVALVSEGAPLVVAHRDPATPGVVDLIEVKDDFMGGFDDFAAEMHDRPREGRAVGQVPYERVLLSRDDMAAFLDDAARRAADESGAGTTSTIEQRR